MHRVCVKNYNAAGFSTLNSFPFIMNGPPASQLDTTVGHNGVNIGVGGVQLNINIAPVGQYVINNIIRIIRETQP